MKTEMEAIYIFNALTKDGYLIKQDGERWHITEPKDRKMPQQQRGLMTMRECSAWAEGCDAVRFANGLMGGRK